MIATLASDTPAASGRTSGFNDRPALNNPNAPENSVAILGAIFGLPGYIDANGNPVDPANTRYIVDPAIRTGVAGRNTLRAPAVNLLDLSAEKSFRVPYAPETHRLSFRVDFFNVLNHPVFTWDAFTASTVFDINGVSDGNVLNPNFNQVHLNGSTPRTGRIQVRYSF